MTDNTGSTPQKRRGRPVDANSGLAKARSLFATLPVEGRTRQSVIEAFQTIDMPDGDNGTKKISKDTAAAYYSVINRKA